MDMQDVLTTVDGGPITVQDVAVHLKVSGTFRTAIYQLIEARVVARKCQELRIQITDQEFYDHAETKRRLLGLFNPLDLNRHCKWHGIVMDQWNDMVRQELQRKKLKEKVVAEIDIEQFFEEHKRDFIMAHLSRIVCADREEAHQVRERIAGQGEDFSVAARRVSIERSTRIAGGYLGGIKHGSLPKAIDHEIFSAQPGTLLGPFEQSGYWTLYRIEAINQPSLDDTSRKNISDHLFTKWLQKQVLNAKA